MADLAPFGGTLLRTSLDQGKGTALREVLGQLLKSNPTG